MIFMSLKYKITRTIKNTLKGSVTDCLIYPNIDLDTFIWMLDSSLKVSGNIVFKNKYNRFTMTSQNCDTIMESTYDCHPISEHHMINTEYSILDPFCFASRLKHLEISLFDEDPVDLMMGYNSIRICSHNGSVKAYINNTNMLEWQHPDRSEVTIATAMVLCNEFIPEIAEYKNACEVVIDSSNNTVLVKSADGKKVNEIDATMRKMPRDTDDDVIRMKIPNVPKLLRRVSTMCRYVEWLEVGSVFRNDREYLLLGGYIGDGKIRALYMIDDLKKRKGLI